MNMINKIWAMMILLLEATLSILMESQGLLNVVHSSFGCKGVSEVYLEAVNRRDCLMTQYLLEIFYEAPGLFQKRYNL